ncbi:MAG: hypothetical protein AAGA60_30240 [Cyanobacteria bacterium P01_E01_bin.42]
MTNQAPDPETSDNNKPCGEFYDYFLEIDTNKFRLTITRIGKTNIQVSLTPLNDTDDAVELEITVDKIKVS